MGVIELSNNDRDLQRAVNALSVMYASASLYVEYMEEYKSILDKYNVKDPAKHYEIGLQNCFNNVNDMVSKAMTDLSGKALCEDWDKLEIVLRDFFFINEHGEDLMSSAVMKGMPLCDLQRFYLSAKQELHERINKSN